MFKSSLYKIISSYIVSGEPYKYKKNYNFHQILHILEKLYN
ncbi:hypothetical protein pb186bvf_000343 [Paramecium bursaria]